MNSLTLKMAAAHSSEMPLYGVKKRDNHHLKIKLLTQQESA
jgi:hypothetical protein